MGKKRSAEEKKLHLMKKQKKLEEKMKDRPESTIEDGSELQSLADVDNTENIPPEMPEMPEINVNEYLIPEEITEDEEQGLEESVLAILGESPLIEPKGQSLHKQVAERWADVLKKGLKKEEKERLFKDNLAFVNCEQMIAPKLNPEVSVAITEMAKKRDSLIEKRQQQISTALSCLGTALQFCLRDDLNTHKIDIIKKLNEASRLLCDSLHLDTRGRRTLVLSSINKDMKEFLLQSEPHTYLFGENLTEKIKLAKSVQKSGSDLKIPDNSKKYTPKLNITTARKSNMTNKALNWRGPPRPDTKSANAAGGATYNNRRFQGQKKKEEKPFVRSRK